MTAEEPYFFCAIGGSGMMPLALLLAARGADVRGSDRSCDQGRTAERFDFLRAQGIKLFPQDGSGVTEDVRSFVLSTAVEEDVADYVKARELGISVLHRAELLAQLAQGATLSLAVAGTSGKSTTTGMLGWILGAARRNPTIVNGAVMKNFSSGTYAGDPDLFVLEVDESDGSIEHFSPSVGVLTNIAFDHKSLEEIEALFKAFLARSTKRVVNFDCQRARALAEKLPRASVISYSLEDEGTDLFGRYDPQGLLSVRYRDERRDFLLPLAGAHNASNALASIGGALAAGVSLETACNALAQFAGIARRLELVGLAGNMRVIDDFAHNPDKIAASLKTLHQGKGRLLVLFQPHGFGPLALMKDQMAQAFAQNLAAEDRVFVCDPLYLGGSTERRVTSVDLAQAIGGAAHYVPSREDAAVAMMQVAEDGDTLVVMGARDDTLSTLARDILFHLRVKMGLSS
ncbi:MAG: Mur ligase family protein [Alphaproteobacteria bacterium]|nr:Mur ligase family protein [Alphaproteobacteria bacterium]